MGKIVYQSTKTYGHSQGFSCCFRQYKAKSHCNFLHGYALKIQLTFEGYLDDRNWVVDFGGLKQFKDWLAEQFDHTTLVAWSDPEIETFRELHKKRLIQLVEVEAVGCEKFAEMIFNQGVYWLLHAGLKDRVKLRSVEVWEHEANSAKVVNVTDPSNEYLAQD